MPHICSSPRRAKNLPFYPDASDVGKCSRRQFETSVRVEMGAKPAKCEEHSGGGGGGGRLPQGSTDILIQGLRRGDSSVCVGIPGPGSRSHLSSTSQNSNTDGKNDLNRANDMWPQKQISVIKIKTWIDKKLTTIDETSAGVLKYKTPHFRATATLEMPALAQGDKLQIGWIQVCHHMHFINTYGSEGVTSWEFPEILSGNYAMISDADGKAYPWYGAKRELRTIKGPCNKDLVTVEMNDNFFPQVTWHVPDETYDRRPRLTHIHRKQKFYTCLAVRDCVANRIFIYKTISWSMELNIGVDPDRPLGERAHFIGPKEQETPSILRKNIQLPVYALKAPNANRSQVLVWRPTKGEPRVVVPPLETTTCLDEYLNITKALGEKYAVMASES